MRAPLAPPRLSEPRKVEAEAQAVETSSATVKPGAEDLGLQGGDVGWRRPAGGRAAGIGSCQIRVSCGHQRAEVALDRPHVAVGQLEPGAGEGVGELVRDARGSGARSSRRPGRTAGRGRWSAWSGHAFSPVMRRRGCRRGAFLACHCLAPAGLLVSSHSNLKRFSKKWLLHRVGVWLQVTSRPAVMASAPMPVPCWLRQPRPWSSITAPSGSGPTKRGIARAVGLAEGVAAGDQGDGLLVVHRHAGEGLADVAGRGERIGVAVRALRD